MKPTIIVGMERSEPGFAAVSKMREILRSNKPWDEARKVNLFGYGYDSGGEVLDSGVNFFVLMLECLGMRPVLSCEGHPSGFYVCFYGTETQARMIARCGYFKVEVCDCELARDSWCMRLSDLASKTERSKRNTLRYAAHSWAMRLAPKAEYP